MDLDFIAFLVFLLLFIGHHSSYFYMVKRFPERTIKTKVTLYREGWIRYILSSGDYLLAVQQARDLINVSVFLASASLIFIGALLNLFINADRISRFSKVIGSELLEFKIMFLVIMFSFSFFCFLSSLRNLRLFSMLIPTPPRIIDGGEKGKAVKYFTELINRASSYYTLGSRGIFYSLPIVMWLISVELFILTTVAMTIYFIFRRDYVFR